MTGEGKTQPTSYPLLSADEPATILDALVFLKVCSPQENIKGLTKAGQGNMNLVLRVTTDQRSVIVKQARPWVEKYRGIAAPDERILSEIEFYRCISEAGDLQASMPSVIASDASQRLLVLEDLGESSDYATLYSSQIQANEVDSVFEQAIDWAARLHECSAVGEHGIGCKPILTLNHQYIFSVPLSDPPASDLDLECDGLTEASRDLRSDDSIRKSMERLGKIYLAGGGPLLHGDYYPGSWLKTDAGFRVIDPEFCFCGPPEFELGVVAAHWIFCGSQADTATIDRVCQRYPKDVSRELLKAFTGAELIRRVIGVAKPPFDANLDRRLEWLQCGANFLTQ